MKKIVDDVRLIFKCCSLYYQDGLGQKEICEVLGISRPTVSRMLTIGKERGIVRIEIQNPDNIAYGKMEREIEKNTTCRRSSSFRPVPSRMGSIRSTRRSAVQRSNICRAC